MWKYFTKQHNKEFILSLDLITSKKIAENKKLNILYAIANNNKKYYTKKYINKKNGGKRTILIPNDMLKNVLNNLSVSPYVTSYLKNKTLIDNAKPHLKQKIILKLDIKEFFQHIDFELLYKSLPNTIFPPSLKVLLLKLCTYDDYLPEGAPTSPMLSNLALKNFDNYIGEYCTKYNINYTRYCDDLTFSGNFNPKKLKNKVAAFIEELGFNLNNAKTKIIKNSKRQIVTGIVVNQKLNIPVNYRKKIRQEMYYLQKYGLKNTCKYLKIEEETYLNSLKGKVNYCLSIMKDNSEFTNYLTYLNKISRETYFIIK